MSLCASSGTGTGEKGCQKVVKKIRNLIWWSTSQEIDIASLQQKPFLEALTYASSDRMAIMKGANYYEPVAPEQTVHTPEFGGSEVMSETTAKIMLKHKTGNCMRTTLADMDGEVIYGMLASDNKVITGVRSSYDKLKTAAMKVNVTEEIIDQVEYKVIELSFEEDEWNDVKKDIPIDYSIKDINPITGLYLILTACTASSATLMIVDCNDDPVDGLTIGNIGLYNDTDGAAAVVGTVVDNGDGTYTIPVTSGITAADIAYGTYDGPASGNLYVQIKTEKYTVTS